MRLIVAVDNNWAIGNDGKLLFHARADMINFKELTTGGVVVMGRKTLSTTPKCKPLPNRTNIILTQNPKFECEGAIICHNKEEALDAISSLNNPNTCIIGGTSIYDLFIEDCDEAIVTKFKTSAPLADSYLNNLDDDSNWVLIDESDEITDSDLTFTFCKYKRK